MPASAVRSRAWPSALITCVETLRRRFPARGKRTLTPLVQAEGFAVSEATVGRILHALIQRHRIGS